MIFQVPTLSEKGRDNRERLTVSLVGSRRYGVRTVSPGQWRTSKFCLYKRRVCIPIYFSFSVKEGVKRMVSVAKSNKFTLRW